MAIVTKKRSELRCPRDPIGLTLEEAAAYVGLSTTGFGQLVSTGNMPCPRLICNRRIWHADEVEKAFLCFPLDLSALKPGIQASKADSRIGADPYDRQLMIGDDPYLRPPRL